MAAKQRKKGALASAGFKLVDPERKRYERRGKEFSYWAAFKLAHGGETLKERSEEGKFKRTTAVAKEMRDAAREGKLSAAKLLSVEQERRLARRSVKSLMRGHTFKSAMKRATSAVLSGDLSPVERRSPFGKLLGVLHAGESRFTGSGPSVGDERLFLKRGNPTLYKRWFGPNSAKARLLVAMGRRDAGATYDVGETP